MPKYTQQTLAEWKAMVVAAHGAAQFTTGGTRTSFRYYAQSGDHATSEYGQFIVSTAGADDASTTGQGVVT